MLYRLTLIALSFISLKAFAQDPCKGDVSRLRAETGFCIVIDSPALVKVTPEEIGGIERALLAYKKRFPLLMSKVSQKGYSKILIAPNKNSDIAFTDFNTQLIVLQQRYFDFARESLAVKDLKFSAQDTFLFHEVLHAFDDDFSVARSGSQFIGWGSVSPQKNRDEIYFAKNFGDTANLWITQNQVNRITSGFKALENLSLWEKYMIVRTETKKFGYPSWYAMDGGPVESFAEVGAFIAFDPEASSYIRPDTYKWFMENVLK